MSTQHAFCDAVGASLFPICNESPDCCPIVDRLVVRAPTNPRYRGLQNAANKNLCCVNAIVQLLRHCPQLREGLAAYPTTSLTTNSAGKSSTGGEIWEICIHVPFRTLAFLKLSARPHVKHARRKKKQYNNCSDINNNNLEGTEPLTIGGCMSHRLDLETEKHRARNTNKSGRI